MNKLAFAATLLATMALSPLSEAQTAKELRVTNTACVCFLPVNLAIKKGWLDEEMEKLGVTVAIQQYEDGPSQTAALLSGSLDIAQYGSTGVVSLLARDAEVSIFMLSDNEVSTEGLVVKSDAGIASVADLEGKTVGVTAGTTSDYGLRAALIEAGVPAEKVSIVGIAPPAMAAAWERGEIQASYVWDPILSRLAANGGTVLQTIGQLSDATGGKYKIVNFHVVSASFAAENPEIVKGYVRAIDRATQYIHENTEEVAAEFKDEFGAVSDEQAAQQIRGEQFFLASEQLSPDLMGDGSAPGALSKLLANVWQFSFDQGAVTTAPDQAVIDAAFDTQFLK